jgi:bacillithiol system protein YtxJ
MKFIPLEDEQQLAAIKNEQGYNVIFKHNTTCPISRNVRRHLELEAEDLKDVHAVYFLDLLAYRNISDSIAEEFSVPHQSPQLLLIKDGQCTYNEALYDISAEATAKAMEAL